MYEDYNNKSYSITAEQTKEVERQYEIAEILQMLPRAISIVGDLKLSEAINELEKQSPLYRFKQSLELEDNQEYLAKFTPIVEEKIKTE